VSIPSRKLLIIFAIASLCLGAWYKNSDWRLYRQAQSVKIPSDVEMLAKAWRMHLEDAPQVPRVAEQSSGSADAIRVCHRTIILTDYYHKYERFTWHFRREDHTLRQYDRYSMRLLIGRQASTRETRQWNQNGELIESHLTKN
jgi:hypothetical protein